MAAHPVSLALIRHLYTFACDALKTAQRSGSYLFLVLKYGDNRACQRVFRFQFGSQKYIFEVFFLRLCPQPSGSGRMSFGQSTGFIQYHHIYFTHLLQSDGVFYQNMLSGSFTDSYHQRSRCSKSQSTGTGYDQNGYGRKNTIRNILTATDSHPQHKRQNGNSQHDRNEDACNTVDDALHRSFAALCFLHHVNDACHSIASHLRSTNDEGTALIDCSGKDLIALFLLYRNRLTANHTFIHIRIALRKLAIHGNLFAGTDYHHIAYLQQVYLYLFLYPTTQYTCHFGLHSHQFANGIRGISFGAFLHHLSGQNEGNDHCGSFVIDVRFQSAICPELRKEGVEQTEKEGYRGTQRNQRIHIATTDLRLFPCPREETSSEEHHYRNSKQHLYLVRVWHMH